MAEVTVIGRKLVGKVLLVVGLGLVAVTVVGIITEAAAPEESEGVVAALAIWWIFVPLGAVLIVWGSVLVFGAKRGGTPPLAEEPPVTPPDPAQDA